MRVIKSILPLLLLTVISAPALAERTMCYHVLEAQCRSEMSDDMIEFVAMTWAIPGGDKMDHYEVCANAYDVQIDFFDYLNEYLDNVPELCRTGVVMMQDVHQFDRAEKKAKALNRYRERARMCMDDDRIEKCVTIEDLDLQQRMGNVRELMKNRTAKRRGAYISNN